MHPTRKIVLASRNHGKVREIASVLDSCDYSSSSGWAIRPRTALAAATAGFAR